MSNASTMPKTKPSIYIDTCIARDITERRSDASIEFIHRIKKEGWTCKISVFGLLELVDIEQESIFVHSQYFIRKLTLDEVYSSRRTRNLGNKGFEQAFKYVDRFRRDHSFIQPVGLSDQAWSLAIVVASNSNLLASDVIHLVSAWQNDCDVVVTDDSFFIEEATKYLKNEGIWDKLRVCKPENCYSVLRELGFSNI